MQDGPEWQEWGLGDESVWGNRRCDLGENERQPEIKRNKRREKEMALRQSDEEDTGLGRDRLC